MASSDPKTYLWQNLCRLARLDDPGVDAMFNAVKPAVGRGTVQRIKEGETSIGLDKLVALARVFGIEAWELLVPGLEPGKRPSPGAGWCLSPELLDALKSAPASVRYRAENAARSVLDLDPLMRPPEDDTKSDSAIENIDARRALGEFPAVPAKHAQKRATA